MSALGAGLFADSGVAAVSLGTSGTYFTVLSTHVGGISKEQNGGQPVLADFLDTFGDSMPLMCT